LTRFVLFAALACAALCALPAMAEDRAAARQPGTSFQTGGGWTPSVDIRSDAAIVYSADKATMESWAKRGYTLQTMGGFRTGDAYIKEHPEEGQTAKDGVILTCGPGSYYMVPTERRIQAMVDFFLQAIENGSTAVIPEEPEYFASAGYSDSFKEAWQKEYGEPWQDPASSFDTRIRAEQLKGKMELKLIRSILQAAEKKDPSVRRMVAHHSPVNYHGWGITFPFDDFAKMTELQEAIGQVWTGTARTPAMFRGKTGERTFETALLEYSSLVELYRGTGKRLWFLADPLEDNPDRTMEDYRSNYSHTLVASLLFPQVNAYELLPWPDRIYGRVPADYATALGCVFHALGEISKQGAADEPGSCIGVLIGDSAAYQRADPAGNDLTGFFGLTLPLIYDGRAVRVAPIERVVEPDYLRSFKVLVLSYDFFKPMKSDYNTALAQWVRGGGQLILIGGSNAYNGAGQWWKKSARLSSPDEHLLRELGLDARRAEADAPAARAAGPVFRPLWKETGPVRDMSNQRVLEIPLPAGSAGVLVRFRDARPSDGWGAMVKLITINRKGGVQEIRPGQIEEDSFLQENIGSLTNADGRFADGTAAFTYLFPASGGAEKVAITAGNQAEVDCAVLSADELKRYPRDGNSSYDLTAYTVTSGAVKSVERSKDTDAGRVTARGFRASSGKGAVEFLGLPAIAFARSADQILQEAVNDALARAKAREPKQRFRTVKRGPYVAAHLIPDMHREANATMTAQDKGPQGVLKGLFVDLFEAGLPLVRDPRIDPGQSRFFRAVEPAEAPYVLAASYETRIEKQDTLGMTLVNKGPLGTPGAVRLYTGGRVAVAVSAVDAQGKQVELTDTSEVDTLCLTFPGSPDGVTISVTWRREWTTE